MVLGAFEGVSYHQHSFALEPGDLILVYSDGLTDAQNRAEEFFGEERLERLVAENGALGAQNLERVLMEAVDLFATGAEQADDITLVVVERQGGAPS
jgi:sigma-B regulation protein RsbU (phosphoserine phosphatase)